VAKLAISNATSSKASFTVPNEPGKSLHIICEVKDDGTPALTSYRRVILKIVTKPSGVVLGPIPSAPTNRNLTRFDATGRRDPSGGSPFKIRFESAE